MENILKEVADRIRETRLICEVSEEEMASCTGVSLETYRQLEAGEVDFSFTFIYKCAARLGVDTTDLLKGSSPTLNEYSITRAGGGLPIARRKGFKYNNLAPLFKNKIAEPFIVRAKYSEEDANAPIRLSHHEGQEYDYILSGKLKVSINGRIEILEPGDSIYYDSSKNHGMVAYEGDCEFLAIIISNGGAAYDYPENLAEETAAPEKKAELSPLPEDPVAHRFIECEEENGRLKKITFKNAEKYNFAYDTVDAIAEKTPDKTALIHLDRNKNERRFTYSDMARLSNRAANYFDSLGIKQGDAVMIVLKRHWQFWVAMLALHKLGAVAIPATHMLVEHDFDYRFRAADVKAIICTADGETAMHAENAAHACDRGEMIKITANGTREGWHAFDDEFGGFSDTFERRETACGDAPMYMLFTSGTTGYPKIAENSYKYALGHYITARYWHNADPNGIHFTISDTGWGKALWGKFYGQWLCESCVFAYDFDKFNADDLLPLFAQYHITSFCAPPTMYRFFIKAGIERYDLSSIRHATIAGEALNPEVFYKFKEYTGLSLMEGYGQTETTLVVANFVGDTPKPGSMGHPSPLYNVEILSPEGKPCDVGETGEICIGTKDGKPCGLFSGYHGDPEATEKAWHDGWYHTGDTAWRDEDGYFWYVGRIDDVIKSSGYRIGPFEIESVIMELPYVLECAVTAAPDPVRGQVVKATIVLVKGKEGTDELKKEIQNYVKTHTAPYKYPRIVEFMDELPKTVSGKIRRVELRQK